mmetsp:Transcript_17886/g.54700  ORF Transcript_17886/g.54700 Transcript_17886/m.54700 type:complete len:201 (-) Transcript_17886:607-1209(-)
MATTNAPLRTSHSRTKRSGRRSPISSNYERAVTNSASRSTSMLPTTVLLTQESSSLQRSSAAKRTPTRIGNASTASTTSRKQNSNIASTSESTASPQPPLTLPTTRRSRNARSASKRSTASSARREPKSNTRTSPTTPPPLNCPLSPSPLHVRPPTYKGVLSVRHAHRVNGVHRRSTSPLALSRTAARIPLPLPSYAPRA